MLISNLIFSYSHAYDYKNTQNISDSAYKLAILEQMKHNPKQPIQSLDTIKSINNFNKVPFFKQVDLFQADVSSSNVGLNNAFLKYKVDTKNLTPLEQESAFRSFLRHNPQAITQFLNTSKNWTNSDQKTRQKKLEASGSVFSRLKEKKDLKPKK